MQKTLIIIAAVISLAAAGLGFLNRSNLQTERKAKEDAVAQCDAAKKSMSAELKTAKDKLAVVGTDSEKNATEITDLRARVEKADGSLADIQKQLAQKEADMTQQKADMAAKDAEIAKLQSNAGTTSQSNNSPSDDIKKQLEEKTILNSGLEEKLKDATAQLTELRQREALRRKKAMRSGLEGRILAVNPSWNFVVLSLGDRNGVVNNAEMLIKRGSQLIGKVRITSVEPSTSIADIVANSVRSGLSVQPGDSVIYMGPEGEADSKQ